jgi:hypothetical protein
MKTTKTILLLITLSLIAFLYPQAQTPGFEWADQMGGDSLIQASSVAVDAAGNQIIIGSFRETADFDPDPDNTFNLTARGYSDIFILKLDGNGALLWAAPIGDAMNMNERGADVTTDAAGNIYATGYFWGTTDVDPGEGEYILSQNRWTTMVLKIEPDGDLIWGKQMGSETAGHAYGSSITVDNNLNVITSGYFYGRVDFDPGPGVVNLTCTSYDVFVQKLDANGNFMWVKQIVGTEFKIAYSMTTDAGGNIYAGGYFKGTVDFNPDKELKYNLTSFGDYDVFILKLTGNGAFGYAKKIGGTSQDLCYSIALDPSGYLYATGQFYGTADFNPGTGTYNMTSFGGNDAYVLKLDLSGNFIWANQIGGASYDSAGDIILDGEGYYYVSGYFYSTTDFDPGTGTYYLTANGYDDSFVFKSDLDGNLIWVIQAGGPGWDYSMSLAVDDLGNIINVGSFEETVDFDPGGNGEFELTNTGVRGMFVQKLNPDGGDDCPVPAGLVAANITETSADLSWAGVTGAGGYFVKYRETETSDWIEVADKVTGTSLTINGLTAATTYEFQVKTDCFSNYSYSFEFMTTGGGCPDIYEPNETLATAVAIPVNTDITALISPSGDVDWFKFNNTTSAKKIKITLTNLPANYDVALYKSNGDQVGISQNPGTTDETIIYNTNKVGTYYVKVYGAGGAFDPINCYTLRAAISSANYKSVILETIIPVETIVMNINPNPAGNVLNIDINSATNARASLHLINSGGQVVISREFYAFKGPNHYVLDLSRLCNGLYIIQLTTEDKVEFRKVLIN